MDVPASEDLNKEILAKARRVADVVFVPGESPFVAAQALGHVVAAGLLMLLTREATASGRRPEDEWLEAFTSAIQAPFEGRLLNVVVKWASRENGG